MLDMANTPEELFENNQVWAQGLVPCKHRGADVTQEALLALWRACRAYRRRPGTNGAEFRSYAYWRVSGAIKTVLRKQGRGRVSLADMSRVSVLDSGYQRIEDKDQAQAIMALMAPKCKLALELYYIKGMNFEKVGKRMGCTTTRAWQLVDSQR
jgi:RNA polymerase sigma factor (sigma-70 family)